MRTRFRWLLLAVAAMVTALTAAQAYSGGSATARPLEAASAPLEQAALAPAAPSAAPVNIAPGHDLLETDPDNTHQDLQIPADFFGPGCQPFEGRVHLEGVPIDAFGGESNLAPTDTIVRRGGGTVDDRSPTTVDIEIVALSLRSVEPLQVNCAGESQQWMLDVSVDATTPQQQGTMTLQQGPDLLPGAAAGGTFESELPVQPKLTFHRVGTAQQVVAPPLPPLVFRTSGPWCVSANPLDEPAGEEVVEAPPLTSNFFLGMKCTQPATGGPIFREKVLSIEQALLAQHGVLPAERKPHYKCYEISDPAGVHSPHVVTLQSQFGVQAGIKIQGPRYLCPPALKTIPGRPTEGTLNVPHQKCFAIRGADPKDVVRLKGQFGTEVVSVGQARLLCLAALKAHVPDVPTGPAPPAPNYECYEIDGKSANRTVQLRTQFGIEDQVVALRGKLLCAPAIVTITNGPAPVRFGTLRAPHLKCYDILGHDADTRVNLETRFGREANVDVGIADLLCIPVKKTHIPHCTLNQAVSHTAGITTVQWQIGAQVPATWDVNLIIGGSPTPIVSGFPIPATDPPVIAGPFSFPFPALGNVTWLTTLSTPANGVICADHSTVFTGNPPGVVGAVQSTDLQLPDLTLDFQE